MSEVTHINRQSYMAELSRLLTFVQKEDKPAILQHYNELLDNAEDEQALLDEFGSPTKLAVTISRGYKREDYSLSTFREDEKPVRPEEEAPAEPYAELINEIKQEETQAAPAVEEAPAAEEEMPAESIVELPSAAEENPQPVYTTNVVLLILYLIFAIPIGIAVYAALTAVILTVLAVGLVLATLGVSLIGFAFSSLLTVLADSLLIFGAALVLLAFAVIFLWLAVWLCIVGYRGVFRGLRGLGRKICVKEVGIDG